MPARGEKGKVQNTLGGRRLLPSGSTNGCKHVLTCAGRGSPGRNCLARKKRWGNRFALHRISVCIVGVILTLCFNYLAKKPPPTSACQKQQ